MTDINPELIRALWICSCIRAAALIPPPPLTATGNTSSYAATDYAWRVVSLARRLMPDLAILNQGEPK